MKHFNQKDINEKFNSFNSYSEEDAEKVMAELSAEVYKYVKTLK